MNRDSRTWLPVGIAVLALGLRLLFLQGWLYPLPSQQIPIGPEPFDSSTFYDVGRVMAGLTIPKSVPWEDVQRALALYGPGYSIFLSAVFRLFGDSPWAVRYLQAMLGGITSLLVYAVGERLGGRRTGALAGLLEALYPTSILFTGRILTETFATFLLWLALCLLTRSRRPLWHGLAGGVLGLACLTRPRLLATLAFLPIASFLSARGTSRRRILQALAFALTALAVLGGWRQVMSRFAPGPTKLIVGAAGFEFMRSQAFRASDPETRGWALDGSRNRESRKWWNSPEGRLKELPTPPSILAIGALNLAFYQVWFLDDAWGTLPPGAHLIQRLVLLLALAGLGIALAKARSWACVLAVTLTLGLVSVKFIEIRHNLPFMPALFLLAGLFVSTSAEWIKAGAMRLSRFALATTLTIAALVCTRLPSMTRLLPTVDPNLLGQAGDAAIAGLVLLWGVLLFTSARRTLAYRAALIVAAVPALLFLTLFGSYLYAASEPRWRSLPLDLRRIGGPIVQEIRLRKPISVGKVRAAYWLVDLQAPTGRVPIRASLNGEWLPVARTEWTRPFCSSSWPEQNPKGTEWCATYEILASFWGHAFASEPQWWALPVDRERLRGRDVVSITLAWAGSPEEPPVRVGTTLFRETGPTVYGPSPRALRPNAWTSLYRWQVADDWRIWEETPVRSVETRAGVLETAAPGARGPEASWLAANQLHLNVRLLVLEDSGRWVVY